MNGNRWPIQSLRPPNWVNVSRYPCHWWGREPAPPPLRNTYPRFNNHFSHGYQTSQYLQNRPLMPGYARNIRPMFQYNEFNPPPVDATYNNHYRPSFSQFSKKQKDAYSVQPCTKFARYDSEHHVRNLSETSVISKASIKLEPGAQDNHSPIPSMKHSEFTVIVEKGGKCFEDELQRNSEGKSHHASGPESLMFTESTIKKERVSPVPDFQPPDIFANSSSENPHFTDHFESQSSQYQACRSEFRNRFLETQESGVNGNSDKPLMFSKSAIKREIENPGDEIQPSAKSSRYDFAHCLNSEEAPEISDQIRRQSESDGEMNCFDVICYKCDLCSFTHGNQQDMYNHLKNYNHYSASKCYCVESNGRTIAKSLYEKMVMVYRKTKFGHIVPMCPTCFKPFANIHSCMNHSKQVHHSKAVYSLGHKLRTWEGEIFSTLNCPLCLKRFKTNIELTAHIENQGHEMYNKPSQNEIALMVCTYCFKYQGSARFNKNIFTSFHEYQIHLRKKHGKKHSTVNIQVLYVTKSYEVLEMLPKVNHHQMLIMENIIKKKQRRKTNIIRAAMRKKQRLDDIKKEAL